MLWASEQAVPRQLKGRWVFWVKVQLSLNYRHQNSRLKSQDLGAEEMAHWVKSAPCDAKCQFTTWHNLESPGNWHSGHVCGRLLCPLWWADMSNMGSMFQRAGDPGLSKSKERDGSQLWYASTDFVLPLQLWKTSFFKLPLHCLPPHDGIYPKTVS